jgi:hypothetical protein
MKLASKDFELAQAQQNLHALGQEVLELRKVKQREGINMDYLKNVVLQVSVFNAYILLYFPMLFLCLFVSSFSI